MKRVLSVTILSALLFTSFTLPAFAQKQKRGIPVKQPSAASETRFASFAGYSDGIRGVWLRWEMLAEIQNIGFHVYRVSKNGTQLLSPEKIVAGSAMRAREVPEYGQTYNYYDRGGTLNDAYYIEALELSGARTTTNQFYPEYVSD